MSPRPAPKNAKSKKSESASARTEKPAAKSERMSAPPPRSRSNALAVYPGTFDPITNGHLDILERALRLFDRVVLTLAVNIRKQPLFTIEERIAFVRDALPDYADRLEFASFDGLLVDFVQSRGALTVVRGLRALADFEYEFQFAHMNRRLAPDVDTIFFMTDERNHYVSSSLVKEVASLGGDVTGLVPPAVVTALREKYRQSPSPSPGPGRPRSAKKSR